MRHPHTGCPETMRCILAVSGTLQEGFPLRKNLDAPGKPAVHLGSGLVRGVRSYLDVKERGCREFGNAPNPACVVTGRESDGNVYELYLVDGEACVAALLGEPRYLAMAPDAVALDLEAAETSGVVKAFARENPEARFDFRCFFLSSPRVELYRKIDARVEGMFVDGIMDEAAWLLNAGIAPGENVPARSIGYRQAMEYLAKARAKEIKVDDASLLELVNEIQMLNRAYAKRQFTWFRGESRYAWINVDDDRDAVARRILSEFDRDEHRAGGEEIGDLSKDELNLLKRYRPALTVLSDKRAVKRVLDSISALV